MPLILFSDSPSQFRVLCTFIVCRLSMATKEEIWGFLSRQDRIMLATFMYDFVLSGDHLTHLEAHASQSQAPFSDRWTHLEAETSHSQAPFY